MFSTTHPSYESIRDAVDAGDDDLVRELVDIKANVAKMSLGRVQIMDNTIMVAGREVTGKLVERILEMVSRGSSAVDGYIRFLDNLMLNPSSTAVKELYLFIESCDLPITADGHFLAYKRVRSDFKDLHSGTFDNSVGTKPTMDRNEVDDNREHHCSQGLHFCSYNYLPSFGAGNGNQVVVVKINPANVVSIPSDYDNAKGRTWTYEVVDVINDWVNDRITPFFTDEYCEDEVEVDEEGYDEFGYDEEGYDEEGYDDMGYDRDGYTEGGYDHMGLDKEGYDEEGYDSAGFGKEGYDEDGFDENGFCDDGYDEFGFDKDGFDAEGLDSKGFDKNGFDVEGYNIDGWDEDGFDDEGINKDGFDQVEVLLAGIKPTPVAVDQDDIANTRVNKLSPNDVRSIKNDSLPRYHKGLCTLTEIAKIYGVHRETIARIDRGDIWASVT
jgi:hypothetical protein